MTPDQEQNMRGQLADYGKGELIDLAISLQDVIDEHIRQKRGMQSAIDNMSVQIPALQNKIEELEGSGGGGADPAEIGELQEKLLALEQRNEKLLMLNEKLQEKLIDTV